MLTESHISSIQKEDLAGQWKLTAVSIYAHGRKQQFFATLWHDSKGHAKLPAATLDKILDQAGVRRGDTYSVA